jgi:hypothetical protein
MPQLRSDGGGSGDLLERTARCADDLRRLPKIQVSVHSYDMAPRSHHPCPLPGGNAPPPRIGPNGSGRSDREGTVKPLAGDLFCGLGGWTEGLLAEGYDVVGFDIERHVYGEQRYPAQLVLQDILTVHGSQFRDATLIVASPPCQEYSYMAMPWSLAKAKAAAIRADTSGQMLADLNRLFDACFRIQAQASLAAGRHIPMVVENVRGAIPWVGRSRWNFGSFHLWGDVPALMPPIVGRKNSGGSWFNIAHNTTSGKGQNQDGRKVEGTKVPGVDWHNYGRPGYQKPSFRDGLTTGPLVEGRKGVNGRSSIRNRDADARPSHGNSTRRKAASAMIAKIPLPLSRHIAAVYRP